MMRCTDRHFRYLVRLISRRTLLYSEMVTTGAILEGDRDRHLEHSRCESPLVLQVGGDDPRALADAAALAETAGFDEVDLNVGCPSDRVREGRFGACLMREPEVVARAVAAMRERVAIPVTVKHRIGVDELDRYEDLRRFVATVAEAGCRTFTVHARIAWLDGLSPKENRDVPPLRYEDVYRLKTELPELEIVLNGGVGSLDEVEAHLEHVDGVMIGRAVYDDPYVLADADRRLFGDERPSPTREEILAAYVVYCERRMREEEPLRRMTHHLRGLYRGRPGARRWRRFLAEEIDETTPPSALLEALECIEELRSAA